MTFQQQFLATYIRSKPPAVRALWPVDAQGFDDAARQVIVGRLLTEGYQLDEQIDVWGWDPLTTMLVRMNNRMTWVPIAQNGATIDSPIAGGFSGPVPVTGAIKVSVDLADYPPFPDPPPDAPPLIPPTPKVANPVGAFTGIPNTYRCAFAQDGYGLTDEVTNVLPNLPVGTFTKTALMAGMMICWVKSA